MKRLLWAFLAFCAFPLAAQELPETGLNLTSFNYDSICKQMDAYFAGEYEQTETDCWDNNFVKYKRWSWFWRDRVLPDGSFPDPSVLWQAQKLAQAHAQARDNAPQWLSVGPYQNTGGGYWGMGRTKHVAFDPFDPYTFYVGTPDGGLWKTNDGGNSWTSIGDELPYLPVGVIRVDYQNPNVLYISLGDKGGWWNYNLGVYKSTDGGQSWHPTGLDWALSEYKVIYELQMSEANPAVLFAATNSGLLRSVDAGDTWQQMLAGEFTDVKFRPNDPSTLYAAKYDYWGQSDVYKSTDGGDNWELITNIPNTNNSIQLEVSLANPDVLGMRYSNGKRFYLSTDAGATFNFQSEMPEDAHFYFSQTNPNIIYCSGVVVFRSIDAGQTWIQITNWYNNGIETEVHADVHDIVHYPHNPEVLFFCNDGGVYAYHEPTETWTDYSNGLGIAQFYRIAVSEAGSLKIAAGSQDNGGWLHMPNGSWRHTNGGDAMCQAIDPSDNNIIFTEYYGGTAIYRSMNNFFGNTVTISDNLPTGTSGDWVTPFVLNPQRSVSMLFGFDDVYTTWDRGDHFQKISNGLTGGVDNKLRDVAYAPSDTNIIVATWKNKVYRTKDGGQIWSNYSVPDANNDIARIIIDPADPDRMWVCKTGYSEGKKVYRSVKINNLLIWQNASTGLPNVPVNCLVLDTTSNLLFAGTDVGVYFTDADNVNWQVYGQGMPAVYVLDLKIRQATHTLYAGTHGRGVWSADLNQVWVSAPEASSNVAGQLSLYPNPSSGWSFIKNNGQELQSGFVRLYDLNGRVVRKWNVDLELGQEMALDLKGLPAGLYRVISIDHEGRAIFAENLVLGK